MSKANKVVEIHLCDDDVDDRQLFLDAMEEAQLLNSVSYTSNGEELLHYLLYREAFAKSSHELPDIILLDLNMPKKNGREALKEIKSYQQLKHIPIIVLTTSEQETDVTECYQLGANSFISKPVTFTKLVEVARKVSEYWFQIVKLPT